MFSMYFFNTSKNRVGEGARLSIMGGGTCKRCYKFGNWSLHASLTSVEVQTPNLPRGKVGVMSLAQGQLTIALILIYNYCLDVMCKEKNMLSHTWFQLSSCFKMILYSIKQFFFLVCYGIHFVYMEVDGSSPLENKWSHHETTMA